MKELILQNIWTILAGIAWLVSVIVTKRYGDIKTALLTLAVAAEEKHGLYDNQTKLEYVLDTIYKLFPNSKLLKLLPKTVLKAILEGLLTTLKIYTKSTTETAMKRANEVKTALDNYSDKLISQDFYGDKNLIANDKVIELKQEVLKEITEGKLNGVLKAYAQTDFTKKGTVAGASAEIKF
jgi:hypothetical protein